MSRWKLRAKAPRSHSPEETSTPSVLEGTSLAETPPPQMGVTLRSNLSRTPNATKSPLKPRPHPPVAVCRGPAHVGGGGNHAAARGGDDGLDAAQRGPTRSWRCFRGPRLRATTQPEASAPLAPITPRAARAALTYPPRHPHGSRRPCVESCRRPRRRQQPGRYLARQCL